MLISGQYKDFPYLWFSKPLWCFPERWQMMCCWLWRWIFQSIWHKDRSGLSQELIYLGVSKTTNVRKPVTENNHQNCHRCTRSITRYSATIYTQGAPPAPANPRRSLQALHWVSDSFGPVTCVDAHAPSDGRRSFSTPSTRLEAWQPWLLLFFVIHVLIIILCVFLPGLLEF